MYVIFPAEELVLMTYGLAIPLISPRPTLDCLHEPKVPIFVPSRSRPPPTQVAKDLKEPHKEQQSILAGEEHILLDVESSSGLLPVPIEPTFGQRCLLLPQPSANSFQNTFIAPREVPSSNVITQSVHHSEKSPQTYHNSMAGIGSSSSSNVQSGNNSAPSSSSRIDKATTSKISLTKVEEQRKHSIIKLEPETCDPTKPRLGPGWGRPMSPMSPMEFPTEVTTKASTSKSRLRPKLHIPLSKLGKSPSTEAKESTRIREDLHLHVENPVFNTENLRQRNFDAFFDSGEPRYKLQPRIPASAPVPGGLGAALGGSAEFEDFNGQRSRPLSSNPGFIDSKSSVPQKSDRCCYENFFTLFNRALFTVSYCLIWKRYNTSIHDRQITLTTLES